MHAKKGTFDDRNRERYPDLDGLEWIQILRTDHWEREWCVVDTGFSSQIALLVFVAENHSSYRISGLASRLWSRESPRILPWRKELLLQDGDLECRSRSP